MHKYVVLLRGINVGGKNKLPMQALREWLLDLGYTDVTTYIASGNVVLQSDKSANQVKAEIEAALPKNFQLDSELIKVLVLTHQALKDVIDHRPKGFGNSPKKFHSDVVFLINLSENEAMTVFDPQPGVDTIWPGNGVIYSQRLSTLRTKSHLNRAIGTPAYKSMTIRNWNTVTKLLHLLEVSKAA